jgi:hypothetical protein
MLDTGRVEPRLQAMGMEEVSPLARILHDDAVVYLAAATRCAHGLDGVDTVTTPTMTMSIHWHLLLHFVRMMIITTTTASTTATSFIFYYYCCCCYPSSSDRYRIHLHINIH